MSRRAPTVIVALLGCAVVFQAMLRWYGGSGSLGWQIPPIFEAAVAAVVALATRSPIGESERATGRWLPFLRLGSATAFTAAAFGALAVGTVGISLLGGITTLLRNVAGMVGVGLLLATGLGASWSWIGTMAYLAVSEVALSSNWHTPWTWPAQPPGDVGGGICAALVFAAGLSAIYLRGARDSKAE